MFCVLVTTHLDAEYGFHHGHEDDTPWMSSDEEFDFDRDDAPWRNIDLLREWVPVCILWANSVDIQGYSE